MYTTKNGFSIKYLLSIFTADCTSSYTDGRYMWQSQVEIEHYSVVYFARIASFEAL